MVNIVIQNIESNHVSDRPEFSFFERLILKRFHPISLFFDAVGIIWVTYFLWLNIWQSALAVIVIERIIASIIVWQVDPKAMASTTLGKLGLLHLHPINLGIQLIGTIVTVWAIWTHTTIFILLGLSVILLGHTFGWTQINTNYSLQEKSSR
jgi:hypothetical protein